MPSAIRPITLRLMISIIGFLYIRIQIDSTMIKAVLEGVLVQTRLMACLPSINRPQMKDDACHGRLYQQDPG